MKKISAEDLHTLSNELYLLAIANLHLNEWQECIQQVELTTGVKELILKKLVSLGDKSFYDFYRENSLWGVSSFNESVTASRVVEQIGLVDKLIENFNELDDYIVQTEYKGILEALIEMITTQSGQAIQYALIRQSVLRKKIEGYIKIKARYENKLYAKHKIFFDILKERAETQGKWKNPNRAVNDVYDEVIAKFEEVDRNFIAERLIELENKKNILLQKITIQQQIVEYGNPQKSRRVQDPEDDLDRFYAKRRQKKLAYELECINASISKYSHALKGKYPFISLGREILFNSDIELSLINCLRNEKNLVKQIIIQK
ncbi:hypothetical protein AAV96_17165 [Acinetobacter sp. AG1]|uniref:hypothetical protein n=1 Tax=Acinetobacter sp. AG1 TaxID=348388 RepID=UPI000629B902|nr:hypothetical protein [Acinetobacter sp. AG1]KKW75100.1 hypothetical protein AAV96_17165 [Acinetobacter sp. AG1]